MHMFLPRPVAKIMYLHKEHWLLLYRRHTRVVRGIVKHLSREDIAVITGVITGSTHPAGPMLFDMPMPIH